MNKLQNRLLGLDKIYELITVPGDFFEAVKRQKLGSQSLKLNEITAAYSRRQTFMADLACDTR